MTNIMSVPVQDVKKKLTARARHRVSARQIEKIESRGWRTKSVLSFAELDSRHSGSGVPRGVLHAVPGGGNPQILSSSNAK